MNHLRYFGLLFAIGSLASVAAQSLETGEITFIGFSTTPSDELAFVALADIPGGEVIYFTDNEWDGVEFDSGEGFLTWTADAAGVSAGSVVTIDVDTPSTNLGTVVESSGSFNLSGTGDDVYAYQGLSETEPTVFLAMIANSDASYDLQGTGLDADGGGTAIVFLDGVDWMAYTGPREGKGSFADYLPEIGNLEGDPFDPLSTGNWLHADSFELGPGDDYGTVFDPLAFSIEGDELPPEVASFNPAEGSDNAGIVQNLVIIFDEGVRLGSSGNVVIRELVGDAEVETIPVGNFFQLEVSGNQLAINPSGSLEFSTGYYVEMDLGFVTDSSGNLFAGLSGSSAWSFTTADQPTLVISQYYEGANLDKYIELHNTTASELPLSGYVLTLWSNSNREIWKGGGGVPDKTIDLSSQNIPAGGYLLLAHPNVADPAYAVLNTDVFDSVGNVLNFNGDDSIVLYHDIDQSGTFTASETIDAIAFTSSTEGTNKSFFRINEDRGYSTTLGDSILSFPEVWAEATLTEVLEAEISAPEYLGTTDDFRTWLAPYVGTLGGQVGFDDDPDGDGVSTGAEWYFFGSHPGMGGGHSAPLRGVATDAGELSFTHLRPVDRTGASDFYEWSLSPAGPWLPSDGSADGLSVRLTAGDPVAAGTGYEEVAVLVEITSGEAPARLFARLSLVGDE